MKLRLHSEAESEAEAARCYLNEKAPELGNRFIEDFLQTLQAISEHPTRFPKVETLPSKALYRRALLKTFRYELVYEVLDYEVVVLALAHTSRQPNYWLHRRP